MRIYTVNISNRAVIDIENIFEYIAYDLMSPSYAEKQVKRIMSFVDGLSILPNRHKLFEIEPWKTYGMHIAIIDNYTVFYLINEDDSSVVVIRIMYSRRDYESELNKYIN